MYTVFLKHTQSIEVFGTLTTMLVPGRSNVPNCYVVINLKLGLQGLGDLTVEGGYFPVSSLRAGGALGKQRSSISNYQVDEVTSTWALRER